MTSDEIERPCAECGMICKPKEYHPYAACLMFKACRSSSTVRANLESVQSAAVEADRKRAQAAEPVAYVNADELDNMLDDRTATIGPRSNWRRKPLYPAPALPAVTEEMLDRAEAAVVMQLCSDNNGDREIARAAIEAALGGGDAS